MQRVSWRKLESYAETNPLRVKRCEQWVYRQDKEGLSAPGLDNSRVELDNKTMLLCQTITAKRSHRTGLDVNDSG